MKKTIIAMMLAVITVFGALVIYGQTRPRADLQVCGTALAGIKVGSDPIQQMAEINAYWQQQGCTDFDWKYDALRNVYYGFGWKLTFVPATP